MYNSLLKKNFFFYILIFFIGFFFNWHYGFLGFSPGDSFTYYQTGFSILNNEIPIRDYWATQGILIDIIQSFLFRLNGVNWKSYLLHSSIINGIFSVGVFYFFRKFGLKKINCFVYSVSTCLIFYPQVGTPFGDFHSAFFSVYALFSFLLAINFKNSIYWVLIPIFIFLGFFSKQAPAIYFFIIISFFIVYYVFLNKDYIILLYLLISSLLCIFVFLTIINFSEINYKDFLNQYLYFPSSIGQTRFDSDAFLKPFTFSRYFLKYKLIHFSTFFLIIFLFQNIFKKNFFYKTNDFISISVILFSVYALIIHQMLTLSLKFIYFYIPIIIGFSNIYILKSVILNTKNNYRIIFFLLIASLIYYLPTYIVNQKFKLSCNPKININEAINSNIIDDKNSVKWLTCLSKPEKELEALNGILNYFLSEDNKEISYALVTDYNFIFTRLKTNKVIFLNQWHNPGNSYPKYTNKEYNNYKTFVLEKLKKHKIKYFILTFPSVYEMNNYFEYKKMFQNCMKDAQAILNEHAYIFNVENCY